MGDAAEGGFGFEEGRKRMPRKEWNTTFDPTGMFLNWWSFRRGGRKGQYPFGRSEALWGRWFSVSYTDIAIPLYTETPCIKIERHKRPT